MAPALLSVGLLLLGAHASVQSSLEPDFKRISGIMGSESGAPAPSEKKAAGKAADTPCPYVLGIVYVNEEDFGCPNPNAFRSVHEAAAPGQPEFRQVSTVSSTQKFAQCGLCEAANMKRSARRVYQEVRAGKLKAHTVSLADGDAPAKAAEGGGNASATPCPYVLGIVYVNEEDFGCPNPNAFRSVHKKPAFRQLGARSRGSPNQTVTSLKRASEACPAQCERSAVDSYVRAGYKSRMNSQMRFRAVTPATGDEAQKADGGNASATPCPYVLGIVYVNEEDFGCPNPNAFRSVHAGPLDEEHVGLEGLVSTSAHHHAAAAPSKKTYAEKNPAAKAPPAKKAPGGGNATDTPCPYVLGIVYVNEEDFGCPNPNA